MVAEEAEVAEADTAEATQLEVEAEAEATRVAVEETAVEQRVAPMFEECIVAEEANVAELAPEFPTVAQWECDEQAANEFAGTAEAIVRMAAETETKRIVGEAAGRSEAEDEGACVAMERVTAEQE